MLLQSEKKYGVYSHRGEIPKETSIVLNSILRNVNGYEQKKD
jgi:hypothetical protein